jgi:hypothetical protein
LSTILKALRRLEEERTAKAERALREQVVSASPRGTGNWRRLVLGGLGVVAGVALLSFAVHHWLARPAAQSAPLAGAPAALSRPALPPAAGLAGNPLAAASRPPPQAPPATSPPASPGVTLVPGGETGFQVAKQGAPRPTPAEVRAAAEALAPRPDVAVVQRPAPSQDLVRPTPEANEPARAPEAAPPGTAPPSPRMAPVAAAAETSPAEDAATSSVPIRLREVDPSIHSPYGIHEDTPSKQPSPHPKAAHPHATPQAGEVVVTRTVWHPSAERRVALVRGAGDSQEHEVHEGESVGSLEVLRIEPSDVVFLRDGVEIRQRVGAQP